MYDGSFLVKNERVNDRQYNHMSMPSVEIINVNDPKNVPGSVVLAGSRRSFQDG
jgi:hypothetical protein